MMGENEPEVSGSNREVVHQQRLLDITIKTETDVDSEETVCGSSEQEKRRSSNEVLKTSHLVKTEDMSTETDYEFIHGKPSHLQQTQSAEKTLPAAVDMNCIRVKIEEDDFYEEYDRKPLEVNFWKSHKDERRMDAESRDAERRESESEEDSSESDETDTDEDDDEDDSDDMKTKAAQNKALYQQKNRCKVCSRSFFLKALLIKHVKEEEKDGEMCGVCGKHFESNESLKLHLQTYVVTNDCEVCLRRFDSHKQLETHARRHTGEKPYICNVCGEAFAQAVTFKSHMRTHKETLYVCSVCGQGFKPTSSSKQDPMLCGVCSEHLDSDESFRMHLEVNQRGSRDQTDERQMKSSEGRAADAESYLEDGDSEARGSNKQKGSENVSPNYRCKVCGRSFHMRALFWKHVIQNEKKTDICGVCGKRFESDESLRLHLQTYMPTKTCKVCGRKFDCLYRLEIHKRSHTGEKPYVCMCGKAFAVKKGLKRHMEIHTRVKMYVCIMCGQNFKHIQGFKQRPLLCAACGNYPDTSESFEVQIKTEDEEEDISEDQTENTPTEMLNPEMSEDEEGESEVPESEAQSSLKPKPVVPEFACKVCGRSFRRQTWFLRHVTENERDTDLCGVCGIRFESVESLQLHLQGHLPITDCKDCGKQFNSPAVLELHLRTHSGEKPYICSVCGKAFSGKRYLVKHMNSHSVEKPHTCEVCNQTFKHKDYLRIHMRTHTGERPFPCSFCGKRFRQSGALALHTRIHTGEFTHTCLVCSKKLYSSSALKTHMRSHTGVRPYGCEVCGKSFNGRSFLNTHMKRHKGEKTTTAASVGKSHVEEESEETK